MPIPPPSGPSAEIIAIELNKIARGEYATTKFAKKLWPWVTTGYEYLSTTPVFGTPGPSKDINTITFRYNIIYWNSVASRIRTYLQESPSIKTEPVDGTLTIIGGEAGTARVLNPLGKKYVAPESLDYELLVSSLVDANRENFETFKKTLKNYRLSMIAYREKEDDPALYTAGQSTAWCGTSSEGKQVCALFTDLYEKMDQNVEILWDRLESLWELWAQDRYNENKENDLEEDGAIIVDNYIIITELDQVVEEGKWADYNIFVRPEASDIPKLTGRYNPPPHLSTRTFAPTAFNFEGNPIILTEEDVRSLQEGDNALINQSTLFPGSFGMENPATKEALNNQLGFLYQDLANRNVLQKKKTKKDGAIKYFTSVSSRISELWGFQFMYNPTAITYGTNTNFSIDAMAIGGGDGMDPSAIFTGTSTIDFRLYINRIIDMSALRGALKSATERITDNTNGLDIRQLTVDTWSKGYPRPITKEDVYGILTRGTEYDLEYLYRVINGDPQPTPSFKNGSKTADFGTLMGMPIWVRFHDNMRYKGIVSGINVNHFIFNHNMIPMLTEVSISLARIPVFAWDSDLEKGFYESFNQNTSDSDTGED
jgi:hypothetical protein